MARYVDIPLEEFRQMRDRIDKQQLEPGDWPIVEAIVSNIIDRKEAQMSRMIAKIAAQNAEQGSDSDADQGSELTTDADAAPDAAPSTGFTPQDDEPEQKKPDEEEPKPKGHGRNGAAAFTNATHVTYSLPPHVHGSVCEGCEAGRMARYREKIIVRIKGQPLFGAKIIHLEQDRCEICGKIIRATAPAEVFDGIGTSYIIYDWSACATLAVMHYVAGAPFKRLESLHNGWGVPMPDSNQWRMVDDSSELLTPLHKAIEKYGVQNAVSLRIDDTGSMVISIRKQIKVEIAVLESLGESTKNVRTGINATGVYLETPEGVIKLFYTGRHHASEIIDQLIVHRLRSQPKLAKVTDAASKNFVHGHEDQFIEATCNAHAFLKFRAIKDKYPAEYAVAGEVYKKVFDNDDEAKARGLTPTERMLFHREHSKPLMEKLKAMCEEKIKSKLVEPASLLWVPLIFIVNQWSRLTAFYREPGIPLDTNLVEQMLIIPVRYLAGSFNYKNESGAEVGDLFMSLAATALANDVEPVAYLTHCLRNHEDLAKRPEHYLPWVYRERMRE
jgi:hypothetical protein